MESTTGPPWLGPEKTFKIEVLRRLENAILNVILANNRAILLIFYAEFRESVLDIHSYPESTIRPTMVGPEKHFRIGGSHMVENTVLRLAFAIQYFIREQCCKSFMQNIQKAC